MQDKEKTKEQLIDELNEMRLKVAGFANVQKPWDENESQYREILDHVNEAIFVIQDRRIKFANRKTLEIGGYSVKDLLASDAIATFVHPDDREMVAQHHASRLSGDEAPYPYDFRIVDKDGNVNWLEVNPSFMMWEGKPAVLCVTTDITQRKRSEEALKDSRELLLVLINSLPVGILYVDAAEQIVFANNTLPHGGASQMQISRVVQLEIY